MGLRNLAQKRGMVFSSFSALFTSKERVRSIYMTNVLFSLIHKGLMA